MSNSARLSLEDKKVVKVVVWDLDDTLWDGILLEDDRVALREGAADLVRLLDGRGILQSIASKNEPATALAKLEEFGLSEFFLYPQINWGSKTASVRAIAKALNIGLDSIAFIDDQPFERDELRFSLPEVLCLDAAELRLIPDMSEFNPRFVTADSKVRRLMYLSDQTRQQAEQEFEGPKEAFLATLGMKFTISRCKEEDLKRAEELTGRTNQLNTTGRTYSYDELNYYRESPGHLLLIADLEDVYGSYGKIGLALVEVAESHLMVKLLLMSCRVMSRGVGTILISHLLNLARAGGRRLRAEFLPNDRNQLMYITYKFAGFKEFAKEGELILLENDASRIQAFPDYVEVRIAD